GMLDPLKAWLRDQRLARGWTVAEMGRQLHRAAKATGDHTVPRMAILASYVRRWEAGEYGVTERYRLHYCAAFGISHSQFGPAQPAREQADELVRATVPVPMGAASTDPAAQPAAGSPYGSGDRSGYREVGIEHDTAQRAERHPHADLSL